MLRHPRLQRLLAAWSADCFHPRLGVEVRGGEKGRSHQESGAPEIEDFVELLALSNRLGACPSASLAVPEGGVHPLGSEGVPQGGGRHRGGHGA